MPGDSLSPGNASADSAMSALDHSLARAAQRARAHGQLHARHVGQHRVNRRRISGIESSNYHQIS